MNNLLKRYMVLGMLILSVFYLCHAQDEPTLSSQFESASCQNWCWMGIEPGVTSRTDMLTILNQLGFIYDERQDIFEPDLIVYKIDWDKQNRITFPYASRKSNTAIYTRNEQVEFISTPTENLDITMLMGDIDTMIPSRIVGRGDDIMMVYENLGVVFGVMLVDDNYLIRDVILSEQSTINLNTDSRIRLKPCLEPAILCNLPTVEQPNIHSMVVNLGSTTTPLTSTLSLATLGTQTFDIAANTLPAQVGSVKFTLNGVSKTDNSAPYTVLGAGFTPADLLKQAANTLTATPYSSDGTGMMGIALTVNYHWVDNP